MSGKIEQFVKKHDEGSRYIFFGIFTVLVSWASYSLFVFAGIDLSLSNTLSWLTAVIFAFVVNKFYVFRSKETTAFVLGKELISFFGSRIFTGVVAIVLFPILVSIGLGFVFFGVEGLFARGIVSGVEIVLNYILSKYVVFNTSLSLKK